MSQSHFHMSTDFEISLRRGRISICIPKSFLFLLGTSWPMPSDISALIVHQNSLKRSSPRRSSPDGAGEERGLVEATPNHVYYRCNTESSIPPWCSSRSLSTDLCRRSPRRSSGTISLQGSDSHTNGRDSTMLLHGTKPAMRQPQEICFHPPSR
jgi:hypothetical protein